MTMTFENDDNVIVYALEKIIAYARRTQQIFVAQCVCWLASIIGLEQGLVNHIDIIQSRLHAENRPEKIPRVGRTVSPTPRDIQGDPRLSSEESWIHPERKEQINNTNFDISDLDLNGTNNDPRPVVPIKVFRAKSRKERKAFNKQKKDQLSQTSSGKIPAKPLTTGQRIYLQCIPQDTIAEYLKDRK